MGNRKPGMAANEVDDPVMGAPEALLRQDAVRFCGEVTISEKQKLKRLPQLFFPKEERIHLRFYVSHIDFSAKVVICGQLPETESNNFLLCAATNATPALTEGAPPCNAASGGA